MIDKIDGAGANPARRIDQANARTANNQKAGTETVENTSSSSKQSESLTVAKIQAELNNVGDVDSAKVERIKTALAEGNYHIDPDKVAKAFTNLEELLNGA